MLDIVSSLGPWLAPGEAPFAVATVVAVGGSVPRPVGTSMAVRGDEIVGSLSGGCVEAAVIEACHEAALTGRAHRESFGWSADDAFAVGLTCGGTLDVHVQPVDPGAGHAALDALRAVAAAPADDPAVLVRRIAGDVADDGPRPGGPVAVLLGTAARGTDGAELDRRLRPPRRRPGLPGAAAQVAALVRTGTSGTLRFSAHGGGPVPQDCDLTDDAPVTLLVETRLPAPRMIVCGANDHGAALVAAAPLLGYRVTLVDGRPLFADPRRFPGAEVVVAWPDRYLAAEVDAGRVDERTVVAVLSHDAKFDVPLLALALRSDLAFVGAMGSRRAHADRVAALRDAGVTGAELARLRSPIGLDLGGVTPAETAVAILAEVVAGHRHRTGPGIDGSSSPGGTRTGFAPLSATDGPIHPTSTPTDGDSSWT
ncbi:hypothetical protein GCM10025865_29050 [Paraoerskovia sediminicola]|uniref:Xanthine dehydrogenase accessory factor n=1 Tax=Paraoerskovia sediminicola TaxID=1138587 RepID=A0ABN6XJ93_9CELL|nr:XdhC/CoxI family protein [Paraoerskovia sediminicola]BDZ43606.1 hypothetical protein GCM10025865_29050 [Paraoerskovia sediminicola]